jgi:hypothetical protein
MRRDHQSAGVRRGWTVRSARSYGQPRWYRASRRASLLRLAIPTTLAVAMASVAIIAAVTYFGSRPATTSQPDRATLTAGTSARTTRGVAGASVSAQRHRPTTAPTRATKRVIGALSNAVMDGHQLNDQGYALLQRGEYAAAIPLLRRAARDLRSAGPADPYEAYANYNLGYGLLQTGQCGAALGPLEAANQLETSPLVDQAIHRAQACTPPGS